MIGLKNDNKKNGTNRPINVKKRYNTSLCSATYHNYSYISMFILFSYPILCTLTHWPVCTLFLYVTPNLSPEQIPGKSLLMVR